MQEMRLCKKMMTLGPTTTLMRRQILFKAVSLLWSARKGTERRLHSVLQLPKPLPRTLRWNPCCSK
jgi:hypothetical protein